MRAHTTRTQVSDENEMVGWAITFFLIAAVAAALGFVGIAGAGIVLAKVVFFAAFTLFLIAAMAGLVGGRSSRVF